MKSVKSQKTVRIALLLPGVLALVSCATLPTPKVSRHSWPKGEAFIGDVKRPYQALGLAKTKVNYNTLDPEVDEHALCRNYFNKAAIDLVKRAKKAGGDAVIDIQSVVFLEDGRMERYKTPECSDDGAEGQVLAQGIVVKWKGEEPKPKLPGADEFQSLEGEGQGFVPDKPVIPRKKKELPRKKFLQEGESLDESEAPAPASGAVSPFNPFRSPIAR